MTTEGVAAQLVRELKGWAAPTEELAQLRQEYLDLVGRRGAEALRREGGPAHLTASCFIFSDDLQQTLLCFHRRDASGCSPEDTSNLRTARSPRQPCAKHEKSPGSGIFAWFRGFSTLTATT